MKKLSKKHQKFVDECAMRAMQGMLPNVSMSFWDNYLREGLVKESFRLAYAMLEEKIKREELDD